MSIDYTVILQDDFDWEYPDKGTKPGTLAEFEAEFRNIFGYLPRRLAEWSNYVVYNIGRTLPNDVFSMAVPRYADVMHYYDSNARDVIRLFVETVNTTRHEEGDE